MNSINLISNKCTLIIIAHRLTTVMRADEIFEFKSGKVINRGNFEDLRKRNLLDKKNF